MKCGEIGHVAKDHTGPNKFGPILPAWEPSYLRRIVFPGDSPQVHFCSAGFRRMTDRHFFMVLLQATDRHIRQAEAFIMILLRVTDQHINQAEALIESAMELQKRLQKRVQMEKDLI